MRFHLNRRTNSYPLLHCSAQSTSLHVDCLKDTQSSGLSLCFKKTLSAFISFIAVPGIKDNITVVICQPHAIFVFVGRCRENSKGRRFWGKRASWRWNFLPLLADPLIRPSSGHVTPGLWVKPAPKTPQRERLLVWETRIESLWAHKLPPSTRVQKLDEGRKTSSSGQCYCQSIQQVKVGPQERAFDWISLFKNTEVAQGSFVYPTLNRWC